MKIQIRQLRPNPYRNLIGEYPIDQKRVEAIASSIRTTGFWDNLIVRKGPWADYQAMDATKAVFELAYGHHRLAALQLLVKQQLLEECYELELPVRNLDNTAMLRIMVAENPIDRLSVLTVLAYIAQETRTPPDEVGADDIAQFVGADWGEQQKRIRGILKKTRAKKESEKVSTPDYEYFL